MHWRPTHRVYLPSLLHLCTAVLLIDMESGRTMPASKAAAMLGRSGISGTAYLDFPAPNGRCNDGAEDRCSVGKGNCREENWTCWCYTAGEASTSVAWMEVQRFEKFDEMQWQG